MKRIFAIMTVLSVISVSHMALAHDGARVEIELESPSVLQAGNVEIDFQLIDEENKILLTDQDLSITHEKKLHLFIFDEALKEFRHEHPEYVNSKWHVLTTLPVNGNYKVWAQATIASDGEEFSADVDIGIKNGSSANPIPPLLGDVRSGSGGISKVTLSNTKIVAGKMAMLTAQFTRTDGSTPTLTPYLGEMAHVVSTPSDGDSLIHVHPMDTGTPNELVIHAEFPKKGDYRLWVQFIDGNILRLVPLSITVVSK